MAANAPYYQIRSSHSHPTHKYIRTSSSGHVSDNGNNKLNQSTSVNASSHGHLHSSQHTEHNSHSTSPLRPETMEENHNPAELVEAAASAKTAALQPLGSDHPNSSPIETERKRKRVSSPATNVTTTQPQPGTDPMMKRCKYSKSVDASENTGSPSSSIERTADLFNVHSAAALFRKTSEKTPRKCTRLPMSKLFISLQLSPESFLHLQAQAKTYMLDPEHPERQSCVGSRGTGDTEIVKLRLFNCVTEFLSDGIGEQYFGAQVDKPGDSEVSNAARALGEEHEPDTTGRLMWPADGNQIIGLVTPLMRRMVTNERQRIYAVSTRKNGGRRKEKKGDITPQTQPDCAPTSTGNTNQAGGETQVRIVDPTLNQTHQGPPTVIPMATKAQDATLSPLPAPNPSEPNPRNINIIVILPDNATEHGQTQAIKATEKDSTKDNLDSANLPGYECTDLLRGVMDRLKQIKVMYPAVRIHLVPEAESDVESHIAHESGAGAQENLQGLAVAANALQENE